MTDDDLTRLRDEVARRLYANQAAQGEHFGIEGPWWEDADALLPLLARKIAEARGEALREAADRLPEWTEGPLRVGTSLWPECDRDAYSLAIEEAQGAIRAALAEPTGPETTQNGPCAPISGPASPRRVSADHRDATDPEERK